MPLVRQAIPGCLTGQIDGLSIQLLDRLSQDGNKYLVKIDHPLIHCKGRHNNPYLQPKAYAALVKAVERRNRDLTINSCLRTPMQQYMLYIQKLNGWCGIRAAAIPGRSNHQSGLAIDIQDTQGWRKYLERENWKYIGDFDPMHFDFKGGGVHLGRIQITEFQKLWNEHNHNQLKVDGVWGAKTANAVANSPSEGFGKPTAIKRGEHSEQVRQLQFLLKQALGLSKANFLIDGHFGSATEKVLREFQRKNGLKVDGIAGQKTLALLQRSRFGRQN